CSGGGHPASVRASIGGVAALAAGNLCSGGQQQVSRGVAVSAVADGRGRGFAAPQVSVVTVVSVGEVCWVSTLRLIHLLETI
ncbi:hypothetical protein QEZ54_08425, partial [Catellatospora sp. KI3]|uniref:hypothetical protein n=1 Tax=Catellatospora sp. KI3 TaxID=3041620 RepID=UPI00248249C0